MLQFCKNNADSVQNLLITWLDLKVSVVTAILNLRKAKTTLDRKLKQPQREREKKRYFKMTSQSFKLLHEYFVSFNLSNVGELSRS